MVMRHLSCSLATLVIVTFSIVARVDGQTPPPDFLAARNQREEARANRDRATFERLTTDGFVVVDGMGRIGDKKERAERLTRGGGGPGPFVATERLNERIAMYNGDTVVLYWQQKAPGGLENVTEMWVRDAGQWKCASAHVSQVR